MEPIPMMNMFDVCRPVQKQHVNAIIRRLIEQDGVLKTIIQEQESREKQDKELLYILKSGLKCDTAILIEHLKEHINELNYRKAGKPYDIFRGISRTDKILRICTQFINEVNSVITYLDKNEPDAIIDVWRLSLNQYNQLLIERNTLKKQYDDLKSRDDKKMSRQLNDNLLNAFKRELKVDVEELLIRINGFINGIDEVYQEIIEMPDSDKELIKSLVDGELGQYIVLIHDLYQQLFNIIGQKTSKETLIQQLNQFADETKKNYETSKIMKGSFQIGQPICATEKMDGTQVRVGFKKDVNEFSLLTHDNNPLIGNKCLITEKDLEPYVPPRHTKPHNVAYQGGDLTLNLLPIIPALRHIMSDYGLEEIWFYFELTFKCGQKTPKQMPYYENPDIMNKLYLFGVSFNLYDDIGIPTDIVKITVNPETQPIFKKYGVNTVPILYSRDLFQINDFEQILHMINNTNYEGVIFCQNDCYLKLLTVYYTETLKVYPIKHKMYTQFAGLQTIYKHYMDGRLPRVKIQSKKGSKQRFNQEHVEVEIRKELSHDGTYHKDELTKFYSIPSTNEQEVRQCLSSSQLYTAIYGSVASSPDFENMLSKRTKNRIFDTVRWYLINNRKNIKTQFDISTSRHTTDVVEDSASVLE
jgi:hypothetical protein